MLLLGGWMLFVPIGGAFIEGDYIAVLPVPNKKKNGVLPYVFLPFFTQQLGIIGKSANEDEVWWKKLKLKFLWIDYRWNQSNCLPGKESKPNVELDLNRPYEELKQGYSKQNKRNIKRFEKQELTITTGKINDIVKVFVDSKGQEVTSLQGIPYGVLTQLAQKLEQNDHFKGKVHTPTIIHNGNILAGAVIMEWKKRAILILLANSNAAKKIGASTALIDAFIQKNAHKKLTFDFEGSAIDSLKRFYLGFGGEEKAYPFTTKRWI